MSGPFVCRRNEAQRSYGRLTFDGKCREGERLDPMERTIADGNAEQLTKMAERLNAIWMAANNPEVPK